ncbi:hypothetical protein TNCV_4615651 [Trichonephila clavipes]|nr:hypothetical protein TNCV_4615651 [Trichonephila clavipes]
MGPLLLRFFCTAGYTNEGRLELATFRSENRYLSHNAKTIVVTYSLQNTSTSDMDGIESLDLQPRLCIMEFPPFSCGDLDATSEVRKRYNRLRSTSQNLRTENFTRMDLEVDFPVL